MNDFLDILERKKNGETLRVDDIEAWVDGVISAQMPDYQIAALLMAIRLNGMNFEETVALTQAMADSGDRLSFPGYPLVLDKHSTGGVGDKVTLVLAPLIAACGLPVAMLSGRGLGFSGGTIDKFESLPGVNCSFDQAGLRRMLDEVGWANSMPSDTLVPADRVLYALRGVTATVDSIPLITASILSKKLAGGATHLCLDVKCGQGAFMKDRPSAVALAQSLKQVGEMGGLKIRGVVSRMETPLGSAVGNYLELLEAVHLLKNRSETPLMELILALGSEMLVMSGSETNVVSAGPRLHRALDSGEALGRLLDYLRFCGARPKALDLLLKQNFDDLDRVPMCAHRSGNIQAIHALPTAILCRDLGAGRKAQEDRIDPLAGITLVRQPGEYVATGDVVAWAYGDRAAQMEAEIQQATAHIFDITNQAIHTTPIVLESF